MFKETATLILKHSDISTDDAAISASASCGSWTNGKQSTTWHVNLEALMGNEAYNENDLFMLRLNQFSHAEADFANQNIDKQVILHMSGLNFVNSSYSAATGNNSVYYHLLTVDMLTTTSEALDLSPNISLCNFGKSSNNVAITIELIRAIDTAAAQHGTEKFPHMTLSFDIWPIKK